jgi:hypothetical protein
VHSTPSRHALSPSHVIVQLVASRHSTGCLHASLPVHETLHGMPDGHCTVSSQGAVPTQVIVHTSFVHVPPAFPHFDSSHSGFGGSDGSEDDVVDGAGAPSGVGVGAGAELVAASGFPTSSTVGLSMHPERARTMNRRACIRSTIVTPPRAVFDAASKSDRLPLRPLLLPLLPQRDALRP